MAISDNLLLLNNTKQSIKSSITNKGIDMNNVPFTEYSTKINEISGGDCGWKPNPTWWDIDSVLKQSTATVKRVYLIMAKSPKVKIKIPNVNINRVLKTSDGQTLTDLTTEYEIIFDETKDKQSNEEYKTRWILLESDDSTDYISNLNGVLYCIYKNVNTSGFTPPKSFLAQNSSHSLKCIKYIDNVDRVTTVSSLFYNYTNLEYIKFEGFNIEIKAMRPFDTCKSLRRVDGNVTINYPTIGAAFSYSLLENIDNIKIPTKIPDMNIFTYCYAIKKIDIDLDYTAPKSLSLYDCRSLNYLRITGFNENTSIIWGNMYSLVYVKFEGVFANTLSFSSAKNLSRESIQNLLNVCKDLTGLETKTLTFAYDTEFEEVITPEQMAGFIDKNWTIVISSN